MSRKNKNNNENENNISFLFNRNENDSNESNENKKIHKSNAKNKNHTKSMKNNNYVASQRNMISNETMIALISTLSFFEDFQKKWDDSPFSIKAGYLVIIGLLLYYYLIYRFHLYISIALSLFASFILFLMNPYVGIVGLIFLGLIIYNRKKYEITLAGTVFESTKIKKKKAYDAMRKHEMISFEKIPRERTTGLYSYSFWIYLNKPTDSQSIYRENEWKSVFYRGSKLESGDDMANLIQAPGVWIKPDGQTLAFIFQNGTNQKESVELPNIEMNQWIHILIQCTPNSASIYKDGKLEVSYALLQSPISMNDYSLYITSDYALSQFSASGMQEEEGGDDDGYETGFDGYLAYLSYYEYNLTPTQIEDSIHIYEDEVKSFQDDQMSKVESTEVATLEGDQN